MEGSGKLLQKIKGLKDKVDSYNTLYSTWQDMTVLVEMADEEGDLSVMPEVKEGIVSLRENLERMKLETLLSGEYDKNNAILALHARAAPSRRTGWRCSFGCIPAGRSAAVLKPKRWTIWRATRRGSRA